MYLQFNNKTGKNGKVYSSVLLCEKFWQDGSAKTKVVLNLTKLNFPPEVITAFKSAFSNNKEELVYAKDIKLNKTIDYGYAFAILEIMKKLRISDTLDKAYIGRSNLIKLMIIGKIITKGSKLGIFNWIKRNDFIAEALSVDVSTLKVDNLYYELGELSRVQNKVETKWNVYHKSRHNDIYLYDITSSYFEGKQNELAAFGYNRDGKKGKMQITIGLITDSTGFPLKIQVFEGNTNDYKTVNEQIRTIKESFGAKTMILVGDRGMRIRLNLEELENDEKEGVQYISALSNSEIRALLKDGIIQLNLFSKELVEIEDNGVRYILSNNPILEEEKTKTRESLKERFEKNIVEIKSIWQTRKDKNTTNIKRLNDGDKNKKLVTSFSHKQIDSFKYRATELIKHYKMTKFYNVEISNEEFVINFSLEEYQQAKQLDGKYIIESTVEKERMDTIQVREKYKELQNVEHAFRDIKTNKLNIRPIFHRNKEQTKGHVFVAMFSYAIIKEMETKIYPWLKTYNMENKEQLSFNDIIDELNNIKMSEIEIGYKIKKLMIPNLNKIQEETIKILNLKIDDMIKT